MRHSRPARRPNDRQAAASSSRKRTRQPRRSERPNRVQDQAKRTSRRGRPRRRTHEPRRTPAQRRVGWRFVLIDAALVCVLAGVVVAVLPQREVAPAQADQSAAVQPAETDSSGNLVIREADAPNTPEPELLAARPVSAWLLDANLVAHAGGAYRDGSSEDAYTNARETLTQNYELKLRAFEFDFSLTTDNDLACLHDWDSNAQGRVDASEWANSTVTTSSGAKLTPMLVGDLYNIMLGLPNMVLVADTKAFQSDDPSELTLVYERLVQAARERNAKLLDRVVPYVYGKRSYEACMEQYPFDNVIYAAYGNPSDTPDGIVEFACSHDNIKGVCVAAVDKRLDAAHIAQLHAAGKKLYTYTINTADAAESEFARGVDAVITDSLTPNDLEG